MLDYKQILSTIPASAIPAMEEQFEEAKKVEAEAWKQAEQAEAELNAHAVMRRKNEANQAWIVAYRAKNMLEHTIIAIKSAHGLDKPAV